MNQKFTFGQKLGAGLAVVVLFAVVIALVGFFALRAVVAEKDEVILHATQELIQAESLRGSLHKKGANARAYLLTREERYLDAVRQTNDEFVATLEHLQEGREQSGADGALLEKVGLANKNYHDAVLDAIEDLGAVETKREVADRFERGVVPKFESLNAEVRALVASHEREREQGRKEASATASRAMVLLASTAVGAIAVAILAALYLARVLANQVGSSVQHIRSSSAELQAAATQQASGSKEQSTAMNEISTTIGELLATSRQIAESGQQVARMAADSAASAKSGGEAVERARQSVGDIQAQVEGIVQHMLTLGKKSQQIGGILELINELADQTNILAINATIEAAGAGESGRRFSVVGEEIRRLADRVGSSAKEIRVLIEEIRTAVNATVMATESGAKAVDAGSSRFEVLQAEFGRIGQLVSLTTDAGREIELSTKQQATAVEQVNVAISNVAQATRETESSSEQTLQTASELLTLSNELMRLVQVQKA